MDKKNSKKNEQNLIWNSFLPFYLQYYWTKDWNDEWSIAWYNGPRIEWMELYMNLEKLKDDLRTEEGYRDMIYLDTRGFQTIGYGHLVKPSDNFFQGKRYSKKQLLRVFNYDVQICVQDAYNLCKDLDINEEAVLIVAHMCFQLGRTKTSKFVKMFEALKNKDYITAGFEMEDSLWRKKHTPARAMRLSEQMKKLT